MTNEQRPGHRKALCQLSWGTSLWLEFMKAEKKDELESD